MNSSKRAASAARETTGSTVANIKPGKPGQFSETRKPPQWRGEKPCVPYRAGHMFGSLRLLSPVLVRERYTSRSGKRCIYLRVKCLCVECGRETVPLWDNVKSGKTTRCTKCAHRASRLKVVQNTWGRMPDEIDQWIRCKWFGIRGRCDDPTNRGYANYGGRGVRLSEEFRNPIAFIDYMRTVGDVQDAFRRKLEIDRINNDRGYERGNLRWSTHSENNLNKRNTFKVEYDGKTMPFVTFVQQYCSLGISRAYRLYREGKPLGEIARIKGRGPRGPYRKNPSL